jgi:hypothetical protein
MIKAIGTFFQIVLFFLRLNKENNKKKAKEGAEKGKEIVDAMAETNKYRRAARLAAALDGVQPSKKK